MVIKFYAVGKVNKEETTLLPNILTFLVRLYLKKS